MEDDRRQFRGEDVERLSGSLRPDLRFAIVADGTVTGVLVVEFAGGRPRRADHPVLVTGERRRRLHSLAASLAECAMSLGLGTGIYRRARGRQVRAGGRSRGDGPRDDHPRDDHPIGDRPLGESP